MEYEFNEHGVCINPNNDIILFQEKSAIRLLSIRTASVGKKWTYGYTYSLYQEGASSPCSKILLKYNSKTEAENAALLSVKNMIEKRDCKLAKQILCFIEAHLKPTQLSLF